MPAGPAPRIRTVSPPLYLRNFRRPKTRGKHVAHKQSAFVVDVCGNDGQPPIGKRHAYIGCEPAVDSAAERPAAERIGTVVDKAATAEETFAAKGLYVDAHPVARLYVSHVFSDFFDDADHLVPYGHAAYCARHVPSLDVQIARAHARKHDFDDRVARAHDLRHGFLRKPEFVLIEIRIGQHIIVFLLKKSFFRPKERSSTRRKGGYRKVPWRGGGSLRA